MADTYTLNTKSQDLEDMFTVANASTGNIKVNRDVLMALLMDHSRMVSLLERKGMHETLPARPKLRQSRRSKQ